MRRSYDMCLLLPQFRILDTVLKQRKRGVVDINGRLKDGTCLLGAREGARPLPVFIVAKSRATRGVVHCHPNVADS